MSTTYALLLFLHVLAAAFWVGGMATMHFAVRPAAAACLEAPVRLAFLANALGRFFRGVAAAIGVLLVAGVVMILVSGGFGRQPGRVHAMLGIGVLMIGLFGHIRVGLFPALRRAVASREIPAAAAKLDAIRRLVVVNLALGVLVFAVALVGRTLQGTAGAG